MTYSTRIHRGSKAGVENRQRSWSFSQGLSAIVGISGEMNYKSKKEQIYGNSNDT